MVTCTNCKSSVRCCVHRSSSCLSFYIWSAGGNSLTNLQINALQFASLPVNFHSFAELPGEARSSCTLHSVGMPLTSRYSLTVEKLFGRAMTLVATILGKSHTTSDFQHWSCVIRLGGFASRPCGFIGPSVAVPCSFFGVVNRSGQQHVLKLHC